MGSRALIYTRFAARPSAWPPRRRPDVPAVSDRLVGEEAGVRVWPKNDPLPLDSPTRLGLQRGTEVGADPSVGGEGVGSPVGDTHHVVGVVKCCTNPWLRTLPRRTRPRRPSWVYDACTPTALFTNADTTAGHTHLERVVITGSQRDPRSSNPRSVHTMTRPPGRRTRNPLGHRFRHGCVTQDTVE